MSLGRWKWLAVVLAVGGLFAPAAAQSRLLNVSYDPTRELYEELNGLFIESCKARADRTVRIDQSHGGSGKQARSVIDGLRADVITLALAGDIAAVEKAGLIKPGWQSRLPGNSCPYTSTIVLVVRKGNPRRIRDWDDLAKPGVAVVTPNPRTSGGARWNFLAAWGYGAGLKGHDLSTPEGQKASRALAEPAKAAALLNDEKARDFVARLYRNVPVLDTGARAATVTFAQKGMGDVLIAWESEAWLALEEFGRDKLEIIYPGVSILAEPPVAMVDAVVDAKGTRALAEEYLRFLYAPEAQEAIANQHYRPSDVGILRKFAAELRPVRLFTIDHAFGGWGAVQERFFGDKGVFDSIYRP